MTAISDRAAVQLALECAAKIMPDDKEISFGTRVEMLLSGAVLVLDWHDRQCAARAQRDALRAPKVELHPGFKGS